MSPTASPSVLAASCTGECQKSGPIGFAVILVLCVLCYFLFKSMSKHLRRVREHFPGTEDVPGPPPAQAPSSAPAVGTATSTAGSSADAPTDRPPPAEDEQAPLSPSAAEPTSDPGGRPTSAGSSGGP